jgi:hypothetical protein
MTEWHWCGMWRTGCEYHLLQGGAVVVVLRSDKQDSLCDNLSPAKAWLKRLGIPCSARGEKGVRDLLKLALMPHTAQRRQWAKEASAAGARPAAAAAPGGPAGSAVAMGPGRAAKRQRTVTAHAEQSAGTSVGERTHPEEAEAIQPAESAPPADAHGAAGNAPEAHPAPRLATVLQAAAIRLLPVCGHCCSTKHDIACFWLQHCAD